MPELVNYTLMPGIGQYSIMALPAWLDTAEYPFRQNYFRVPAGRMQYVDEGSGDPIVFVHGNPAWSFEFRNLIKAFAPSHRCIAPDLIGFGLSDKPYDWSYLPIEHARNLDLLLESLALENITLVVGDWGGPVGLSYALAHTEKIRNIVITNTWLWPVDDDWYYQVFSRFMGGPVGRWLIRHRNFFAKRIVPSAFGDKRKLNEKIHHHYLMPLAVPEERKGCWVFPGEIIGSTDWLRSLWEQHSLLSDKKILIAWGMKDIAFRKKEMDRWAGAYPSARVVRFEQAGHFVPEECPEKLAREMRELMAGVPE